MYKPENINLVFSQYGS